MPAMEITGLHYATGRPVVIRFGCSVIESVEAADTANVDVPFVGPGLVDLQINGFLGRDFNRVPIPDEALSEAVRLMWKEGVTSFFPTVITNSAEAIEQAMKTIAASCDRDPAANRAVAGIHLEGPFISPEDGARGAHAKQYVRAPDWDLFQKWQQASGGRIKILTMSPEWPSAADFIREASAAGVTISIGHTSATSEQIREAVIAGARLSTHLGNGAHLMLPRHPNYIWEQLAQDALWSCVIPDGFHIPEQVLKVIMKVKGEQTIAVSDAVSLAGLPAGTYDMPVGGKVVLTPAGRLHLAENEKLLAGSAQMLLHGIMHLTKSGLASLGQAWDMSSIHPAKCMRMAQAGGLSVGAPADLVLFRKDGERYRVAQTYVGGERVA
jgi:N-acetylglucosamine-6-phosphate deacetylase